MRFLRIALLLSTIVAAAAPAAAQQRPYTPARGSAVRTAIMDGIRAGIRDVRGLDRPVVFRVHKLAVLGDWALTMVTPQTPEGARIPEYERELECDREIIALLHRRENGWRLVERDVGPCDYAWRDIFREQGYPAALLEYWENLPSDF
ncbi:MAG TPA: hypothetical protein VHG08_18155 [Longimicrobium sp.]|nr:hypothetical protein [Longimicrobium sp.]